MKTRSQPKFRPLLAIGIAVVHFVLFIGIAWFVIIGSLSSATGPGGPSQEAISMAEIIGMIMAPTLLLIRLCGIEKLDFQILLLAVAASSALYGIVISLLISRILSQKEPIRHFHRKTDSGSEPY